MPRKRKSVVSNNYQLNKRRNRCVINQQQQSSHPVQDEPQHLSRPNEVQQQPIIMEQEQRLEQAQNQQPNEIVRPLRPNKYLIAYNKANEEFTKLFLNNDFGHVCDVCDRLWFKKDLTIIKPQHKHLIEQQFTSESTDDINQVCQTCKTSLSRKKIPTLCKYNGYRYPEHPSHLPHLDFITERLISPRIPFMQVRRLRRESGTYKMIGQIINVPIDVNNMVHLLPRHLDDDYAININIKRNILHKSTYLQGQVNKRAVKTWLIYMCTTPLYRRFNIQFNEQDLNVIHDVQHPSTSRAALAAQVSNADEGLELVNDDNDTEMLIAQQQTLLWNEGKYLDIAPGQNARPLSIIYDTYAEELSFPAIYYGQPRVFKQGVKATPFNIERLQNYKLLTVYTEAEQFIKPDKFTLISFNVQSLNAHKDDIEDDKLLLMVNCLLLNETWVKNDDVVNIQNFQLVTQQKHNNTRSGGVSIYLKPNNNDVIQPLIVQNQFWQQSTVGDLCGMKIILNNVQLLIISIYIHPNTSLHDLKIFLMENLILYTTGQNLPILSGTNYSTIPIILAGDFNTDILKDENQGLLEFMNEYFNFKLMSSKSSTTTGNTCIDMVFARNINIQCHTHLSYFSYHKPILIQIE